MAPAHRQRWQGAGQRDVADVLAVMPQRRANDCATPDQPPVEPLSDARTIDALTAHLATLRTDYLATLRELVFKADALVIHEREQVDAERQRADRERVRADAERDRADHLAARLETLLVEKAEAAEKGTEFEHQLAELKALVDQMRSRPWWRRLRLIVPQPFVPAQAAACAEQWAEPSSVGHNRAVNCSCRDRIATRPGGKLALAQFARSAVRVPQRQSSGSWSSEERLMFKAVAAIALSLLTSPPLLPRRASHPYDIDESITGSVDQPPVEFMGDGIAAERAGLAGPFEGACAPGGGNTGRDRGRPRDAGTQRDGLSRPHDLGRGGAIAREGLLESRAAYEAMLTP